MSRSEYFISIIPRLSQRQDSVREQLDDLVRVAIRLGMYDAADWIETRCRTETGRIAQEAGISIEEAAAVRVVLESRERDER